MNEIYVVKQKTGMMGKKRTLYVGQDVNKATEIRQRRMAAIEVWEDGEKQFTTRNIDSELDNMRPTQAQALKSAMSDLLTDEEYDEIIERAEEIMAGR